MIEFRSYDSDPASRGDSVTVQTDVVTLDELVLVFERFLLACGYGLPGGAHIGYEYEEDGVTDDAYARESSSESTYAEPGGAETHVTPDAVVEALREAEGPQEDTLFECRVLAAAVRLLAVNGSSWDTSLAKAVAYAVQGMDS